MNSTSPDSPRITNLQILRAFAALNVVVFHTLEAGKSYSLRAQTLTFLEGWGLNGVDLFFVISGFVMVYIQRSKERSAWEFLRERIVRILPAYWALTLLMSVLLLALPSMFRQMAFSFDWAVASLGLVSGLLKGRNPILYLGWTIEYELGFYLLFSLSILTLRNRYVEWLASAGLVLGVLVAHIDPLVLEFVFGMLIAHLFLRSTRPVRWGSALFWFGLCAFLASLFWKNSSVSRVLIYGLPSAFMVAGAVNSHQLGVGLLTRLGDASYSLYLVQVFTIPVIFKLSGKVGILNQLPGAVAFLSVALTTLCGWGFYRYFELSVSGWIKSWQRRSPIAGTGP